jgi:hypothetical protein
MAAVSDAKKNKPIQQDEIDKLQVKKEGLLKLTKNEKLAIKKVKDPQKTLNEHTTFVKKHFNTVMAVAEKLYYIKEHNLFRLKYNSFKEYVNKEFNYTRGRAYQLATAHEIAAYVNSSVGTEVLTTEPQCRELSKIKVYTKNDHQKVDNQKSNQKRLKLIQKILEKNDNKISTQNIVDVVRKELDKGNTPFKERYENSIEKCCDNLLKMISKSEKKHNLKADDFALVKKTMLEKLQATLKEIEKL